MRLKIKGCVFVCLFDTGGIELHIQKLLHILQYRLQRRQQLGIDVGGASAKLHQSSSMWIITASGCCANPVTPVVAEAGACSIRSSKANKRSTSGAGVAQT